MVRCRVADPSASLHDLLPQIYDELRAMARHLRARYRSGDSIRPTSMIHAAYLRLVQSDPDVKDPAHAAALASRAMRNVLIDRVRRRTAQRRGGGLERIELGTSRPPMTSSTSSRSTPRSPSSPRSTPAAPRSCSSASSAG